MNDSTVNFFPVNIIANIKNMVIAWADTEFYENGA